jgi:CDP-paratose 2-epimerase
MATAIVTGSSGLVGAEAARRLHAEGLEVVGIDNNLRRYFFGEDGSVEGNTARLRRELPRFTHEAVDIRDAAACEKIFRRVGSDLKLVVHAASQPSHDWAAREPVTDFSVNAAGTLNLLEATRKLAPGAVFVFTSTNKVYGDRPNGEPLAEQGTRWELASASPWAEHGFDEMLGIDQSMHSLFGVSKAAADLLVQEYGRYFGMTTVAFRCGCITGSGHAAAELHGFLGYLVKCVVAGRPYRVFGHKAKQVRDNLHARDLVDAFWRFFLEPRAGGAVYNLGGSRHSHCSMLEAIALTERLAGRELRYSYVDEARAGDHAWWVSDVRKFRRDYPSWRQEYDIGRILRELVDAAKESGERC